jgi:hypothetical protein
MSLLVGEALVLPLGMWPECLAHTRGCAGAVLGGQGAAGRRCASPPRRPAGRRCRPPAASVGRRRGLEAGVCATRGAPPARPSPARPLPSPGRRGMAGGAARPPRPSPLAGSVPLCPRARHSPLPLQGKEGGRGQLGRGRGEGAAAGRQHCPASAQRLAVARASS